MELDDLKSTWAALNERLKNNNILNEVIIMEMAQSKVEKTIHKLLRGEITGTIILFLLVPLIAYLVETDQGEMKLFWNVLMIVAGITCVFLLFWEIYKVSILIKIDLSKEINSNIYYVNKYRIQINREFLGTIYFIIPVFFILGILTYAEANASYTLWLFLICLFSMGIFLVWYSKKKYKKIHDSILSNLNEIKELKEE